MWSHCLVLLTTLLSAWCCWFWTPLLPELGRKAFLLFLSSKSVWYLATSSLRWGTHDPIYIKMYRLTQIHIRRAKAKDWQNSPEGSGAREREGRREGERKDESSSLLTLNSVHSLHLRICLCCGKKWKICTLQKKTNSHLFPLQMQIHLPKRKPLCVQNDEWIQSCPKTAARREGGRKGWWARCAPSCQSTSQNPNKHKTGVGLAAFARCAIAHMLAPALHNVHYTLLQIPPPLNS